MLDKALAVQTLAGCEKYLQSWAEIARMCRNMDDEDGERLALAIVDPLLDLRAVLTEHVETATIPA